MEGSAGGGKVLAGIRDGKGGELGEEGDLPVYHNQLWCG